MKTQYVFDQHTMTSRALLFVELMDSFGNAAAADVVVIVIVG